MSSPEQVPHPHIPQPPAPYYAARTEPGTDEFAITGFVLAMVSIVAFWMFVPPVLGIVFSAIGMSRTKDGERKGRGLAVAGLTVSIMISVGLIVWIIAVASASSAATGASWS